MNERMAVEVMGWERFGFSWKDKDHNRIVDILDWHPDTDLNQAMRCLLKFCEDDGTHFHNKRSWRIGNGDGDSIDIDIDVLHYVTQVGKDELEKLPLAICEAIKKVLGGKYNLLV